MLTSSSTNSSPQTENHLSDIEPEYDYNIKSNLNISRKRSLDLVQGLGLNLNDPFPNKKKKIGLNSPNKQKSINLVQRPIELVLNDPLQIVKIKSLTTENNIVPENLCLSPSRGRGRPRKNTSKVPHSFDATNSSSSAPKSFLKVQEDLPKPNFKPFSLLKEMEESRQLPGYYYFGPTFDRPETHYLRLNESNAEQKTVVEYDLDLEDKSWIELFYDAPSLDDLSEEIPKAFEYIIDSLEKEWFDMTRKNELSAQANRGFPQNLDAPCDICRKTDCENSNAIVFCDGCDLAVHQDCYGIPYIPEGQWLCRKCMLSPEYPVECILCPNEGGAFKQTSSNSWAHLNCALWIPEITFGNSVYMEPIEGISKIPKSRKKLLCYLCKRQNGACIQCYHKSCTYPFHVTCAKAADLCMRHKISAESVDMRAFCHKHTPKYYKKEPNINVFETKSNDSCKDLSISKHSGSKAARAHNHSFNSSKHVIPEDVYQKILRGASKFKIPKPKRFVNEVCKYWSLKKESCRGAPLIKRLHIEPWTVAPQILQTEEEKLATYGSIKSIRSGLEKTRMLIELVRKRETSKLNILKVQHEYWENYFFPQVRFIRTILAHMIKLDTYEYFTQPVSKEQAPDYYEHVKAPMDLGTLSRLINSREITNLEVFKTNLLLVYDNCLFFNDVSTCYYKAANRHKKKALEFLDAAFNSVSQLSVNSTTNTLSEPFNETDFFADCYKSQLDSISKSHISNRSRVNSVQLELKSSKGSVHNDDSMEDIPPVAASSTKSIVPVDTNSIEIIPPAIMNSTKDNSSGAFNPIKKSSNEHISSNLKHSKSASAISRKLRTPVTRSKAKCFDSYFLRQKAKHKLPVLLKGQQTNRSSLSFRFKTQKS